MVPQIGLRITHQRLHETDKTRYHGSMLQARSLAPLTLGVLSLIISSASSTARAGNGDGGAPTPLTWPQCSQLITTVDRSVSPIINIPTSFVGMDDLRPANSTDEPADSRTHQLFATCRQRIISEALPRWITRADYDAAARLNNVLGVPSEYDILDSSPAWQGCAHRINADDDRHEITLLRSLAGFNWDTSNVPPGTYHIEGYTLEPPSNSWAQFPRPGVIRVVDSRDPSTNPPAVVVRSKGTTVYRDEAAVIESCIVAVPGSTYQVDYALAAAPPSDEQQGGGGVSADQLQWSPLMGPTDFDVRVPVSFEFTAPPQLVSDDGAAFLLRVTAVDPLGQTASAYTREAIDVLGLYQTPPEDDTGLGEETGDDSDGGSNNCSLSPTGSQSQPLGLLALLLVGGWRFRRSRRD